ncbi:MAG: winged helix DNA-binding domain-containing protein [Candidatus Sericytochromatia bacterium]
MPDADIGRARLASLGLSLRRFSTPEAVVAELGALQAQDYEGAKWALALRLPTDRLDRAEAELEKALAEARIVRSWPMRGTLHLVPGEDLGWMLALMASRVIAGSERRLRQLELDADQLERSGKLLAKALAAGPVTREALLARLDAAGISTAQQRGYHILTWHAQQGLICLGPMQGKQQTFVLLADWVKKPRQLARDAALGEIARRYFRSHGPATLQDFARWTGLSMADARTGLEAVRDDLAESRHGQSSCWGPANAPEPPAAPAALLLPGFDEFILGYRDRDAVLAAAYAERICPGKNGMFLPTIVLDGRVAGTWKRQLKKKDVLIALSPFGKLKKAEREAIAASAADYGRYLRREARISQSD